jgi:endoglucanase
MNRREFLKTSVAAGVAAVSAGGLSVAQARLPDSVSPTRLPRWRGFNLLEKFTASRNAPYREQDFAMMAEWGFDFVRLPCSYHCWSSPDDWLNIDDNKLKDIDQAIEFGQRYGIHVNINFHRAPGYCVNPPAEPKDLWTDQSALDATAFHWRHFATRYKDLPSTLVSFDLLNEPARTEEANYVRIARYLIEAIRSVDPTRLIVADGHRWGNDPVHGLADMNVAQSTRGYQPMHISHYKATWIAGSDKWAVPTWPLKTGNQVWDKERLRRERIEPWQALEKKGVGIHVGEWGAFMHTPHDVALAWMADNLDLWKEAGWGWALWNLRGGFGILDTKRPDVQYEPYKGHQLDRKMLELLRAN